MENQVLAVVAGDEITERELNAFMQGLPPQQQAYVSNPQFREQCLEQLIALYLFIFISFSTSWMTLLNLQMNTLISCYLR